MIINNNNNNNDNNNNNNNNKNIDQETRMELEKMNSNLLSPIFLHNFDPFIQSKEVHIIFEPKNWIFV